MPEIIVTKATPHELHKMLCSVVSISKKGFVAMGKILRELKDHDKFKKAIGSGIDTWEEYLRQPEIGLSTGEANRLISIYQEFVLRLGYDEETISKVPLKNVHYLLTLAKKMKTQEEVDPLLADATLLSQKDFKLRIYDAKAEEMGIAATKTLEYFIMAKTLETGTLERVMGISSDLIKDTFNL